MVKADPKIGAPKIAASLVEHGGSSVNPQTIKIVDIHMVTKVDCPARNRLYLKRMLLSA